MPADSDAQPRRLRQRAELCPAVLAAISAGGALGGAARYALGTTWAQPPGRFPWATFVINVAGCLLIGGLMVLLTERWPARRLLRPFLGVGVLGGFTTFAGYAVQADGLLRGGTVATGLAYLFGTLFAAVGATYAGITLARAAVGRRGGGR